MNARVRTLLGVVTMTTLLVLYFFLVGVRAIAMLSSGDPVGIVMGLALFVLPLVGAWALWRELSFGKRAAELSRRLEEQGMLPTEDVDVLPSGKPVREQAEQFFPKYRAEVEAAPDSWEAWMRLGMVYDACGDRRRARKSVNAAIALSRGKAVPANAGT